jgi:hypothetical protein
LRLTRLTRMRLRRRRSTEAVFPTRGEVEPW